MIDLQHSSPVSLVIHPTPGEPLEAVQDEANALAQRLQCDVAFCFQGKVVVCRPAEREETS